MDVALGETQPAQSQNEASAKLDQPNTWRDLLKLIGIFGFYSQFLPLYDLHIRPWKYILSNNPQLGTLSQKEDMELMQNLWTQYDQRLLEWLNKYIEWGPNLAIPDPYWSIYLKTDKYKDWMGTVLLQKYDSVEARKSEEQENDSGKCEFGKSQEGICLRTISFISWSIVSPLYNLRLRFGYKAAAVRWAIGKFKNYLCIS